MKKQYIAPQTDIYEFNTHSSLMLDLSMNTGDEGTPLSVDDDIVSDGGMAWMKSR